MVGYRDVKRRGIYLALFTDLDGDSCFSIYQISWIKIRKVTFVQKRRHLVKSLITFQLTIYDFVANSVRSFFSTDQ